MGWKVLAREIGFNGDIHFTEDRLVLHLGGWGWDPVSIDLVTGEVCAGVEVAYKKLRKILDAEKVLRWLGEEDQYDVEEVVWAVVYGKGTECRSYRVEEVRRCDGVVMSPIERVVGDPYVTKKDAEEVMVEENTHMLKVVRERIERVMSEWGRLKEDERMLIEMLERQ